MKDKPFISTNQQPVTPDRKMLTWLAPIAQVYKAVLLNVSPDSPSRKLLIHISENVLLKIGTYVITYIHNLGRAEDEKAN